MTDQPTDGGDGGTAPGAAILEARNLHFRYPGAGVPIFDGLSLAIGAGDFLGLIGPNGSGKTSLLRLLSGTLRPSAGEVRLEGRSVHSFRPRERAQRLAVVPQESRILFNFSVMEMVLMGRAPHLGLLGLEGSHDRAIARHALEEMDLGDREETPLRELSSGERQRALVARALAQEPAILLLDEATAFLDLKHRLQIGEILSRLNREQGLTIMAISHDLNMAARYSSRLALLKQGRIVADGTPAEVLTPDQVRAVYETEVRVEIDPSSGAPYVIPRSPVGA
ncbi:MAG: ABC transporter ATP-binding protein [Acidobacteriota bacterium]